VGGPLSDVVAWQLKQSHKFEALAAAGWFRARFYRPGYFMRCVGIVRSCKEWYFEVRNVDFEGESRNKVSARNK